MKISQKTLEIAIESMSHRQNDLNNWRYEGELYPSQQRLYDLLEYAIHELITAIRDMEE